MKKTFRIISVLLTLIVCVSTFNTYFELRSEALDSLDMADAAPPRVLWKDVLAGVISLEDYYSQLRESPDNALSGQDSDSQIMSAQTVEDGTYYLNNKLCGKYIYYNSLSLSNPDPVVESGLICDIGTGIKWLIQSVDGGKVIKLSSDPTKYLAVSSNAGISFVEIVTIGNDALHNPIPDRCKWEFSVASGGGCLVKSVYNSKYLYTNGVDLFTSENLGTPKTDEYYARVWRVADSSYYGNTSSHYLREFTNLSYIENVEGDINEHKPVTLNLYYNEIWCEVKDFNYYINNKDVVTLDSKDLILKLYGGTKINAIHKVTGIVKTFYVIVGFSANVNSTPLADTIIEGLNEPHDVWPAGPDSRYYTYDTVTRGEELRNIYERTLLTITGGAMVGYPEAASMLSHFLDNKGEKYTVEMKRMLSEWDTAKTGRIKHMNYVMQAVEASAETSYKTIRTINAIGYDVLNEPTNWGRAVGSYYVSIECTYKKTSSNTYTMNVVYELHDVYNWNKDDKSMGKLPVSPRDMWELHHGGVAKNYEVYGKNTFTVTWTQGKTFENGATISNET